MRAVLFLLILNILIGFFQSCGIIGDDFRPVCCTKPQTPSDQEFKVYVDEFEYYSSVDTSLVPIYFADLEDGIAGVCHYFRVGGGPIRWGYIEIDKEYWITMSELQKINLVFHELGHCVLGRDHYNGNSVNMCPDSFMFERVISHQCLFDNYNKYLKEMFPDWSE